MKAALLVAAGLSLGLAGCDGVRSFDRDYAGELLESTAVEAGTRIPLETFDVAGCLSDQGYLVNNLLARSKIGQLGEPFFEDWEYRRFRGGGYIVMRNPVMLSDVTVTGLAEAAENGGGAKLVEFNAKYDFTSAFPGQDVPGCLTGVVERSGTAQAREYDDGWRIEIVNLPILSAAGPGERPGPAEQAAEEVETPRSQAEQVEVSDVRHPAPGSAERRLILDTVRDEGVQFIVHEINVADNMAYAHITPTVDGAITGEDRHIVLEKMSDGVWNLITTWGYGEECADVQAYRFAQNNAVNFPAGVLPQSILGPPPVDGGRGC